MLLITHGRTLMNLDSKGQKLRSQIRVCICHKFVARWSLLFGQIICIKTPPTYNSLHLIIIHHSSLGCYLWGSSTMACWPQCRTLNCPSLCLTVLWCSGGGCSLITLAGSVHVFSETPVLSVGQSHSDRPLVTISNMVTTTGAAVDHTWFLLYCHIHLNQVMSLMRKSYHLHA